MTAAKTLYQIFFWLAFVTGMTFLCLTVLLAINLILWLANSHFLLPIGRNVVAVFAFGGINILLYYVSESIKEEIKKASLLIK